jgi:hypothetical protein
MDINLKIGTFDIIGRLSGTCDAYLYESPRSWWRDLIALGCGGWRYDDKEYVFLSPAGLLHFCFLVGEFDCWFVQMWRDAYSWQTYIACHNGSLFDWN